MNPVIQTLVRFDVLNRLPRTGFLFRGMDPAESVGEHSFSTSVLAVLVLEELKAVKEEKGKDVALVDGEKLLKMTLLHEAGEILIGDIPAPASRLMGKELKSNLERKAGKKVLENFPGLQMIIDEIEDGLTLEAKILRALDKVQMMIKVLICESEGRGNMADFWAYPDNFRHCGIECIDRLVDQIRDLRGNLSLDYLEFSKE